MKKVYNSFLLSICLINQIYSQNCDIDKSNYFFQLSLPNIIHVRTIIKSEEIKTPTITLTNKLISVGEFFSVNNGISVNTYVVEIEATKGFNQAFARLDRSEAEKIVKILEVPNDHISPNSQMFYSNLSKCSFKLFYENNNIKITIKGAENAYGDDMVLDDTISRSLLKSINQLLRQ